MPPPQNTLVGRDKYTITSLYKHVQGSIGEKTKISSEGARKGGRKKVTLELDLEESVR